MVGGSKLVRQWVPVSAAVCSAEIWIRTFWRGLRWTEKPCSEPTTHTYRFVSLEKSKNLEKSYWNNNSVRNLKTNKQRNKYNTHAKRNEGFVSKQFSVGVQVTFWSEIFRILPHFGISQHRVEIDRNDASLFRILNLKLLVMEKLRWWFITLGMVNPRSCVSFMARWGTPSATTLDILNTSITNASVKGKL